MTRTRQEAIRILEKVPEDKLDFVIQIMQGVNGLLGISETEKKIDLKKYMGRGEKIFSTDAQEYIKEMRANDRI